MELLAGVTAPGVYDMSRIRVTFADGAKTSHELSPSLVVVSQKV